MSLEILVILAIGTIAIWSVASRIARRRSLRIKLAVIAVVYFLFSGVGIALNPELAERYLFPYFLFLASLQLGVVIAGGRSGNPEPANTQDVDSRLLRSTERVEGFKWWSDGTATLLALVYLLSILGQLLLTGRWVGLFEVENVILNANKGSEIFTGRIQLTNSSLFVVLSYLKLICLPFFYIELQRRFEKKWVAQLVILLLITYMQVVVANQWGRNAWLQPILIWLMILLYHRRISGPAFSVAAVAGFVVVVPVMNAIASWRQGSAFSASGGLLGNLSEFSKAEFSYPDLYPIAESMGSSGEYIEKYLYWLVTMPLPGSLTGGSFSVTQDFSEHILGLSYGKAGFYVLLPNWLGESFIAFGQYFAVWGLLVGLIIGLIDRFLSMSPNLITFDAFITGLLAIYLRNVSQEFLAQAVGAMWLLIAMYVVHRLGTSGRTKSYMQKR